MDTPRSDGFPQPTLLLADNSVTIQRVVALTFLDEGIRVVAVSDGTQAIKVLDQTPPDIVIADVALPEPNGYDLARYIKETPRLAHIPILLSAGAFEPVDQARAAKVGCATVLSKPFEPQRVIDRVKEFLSKPVPSPLLNAPLSPSSGAAWSALPELPLAPQGKSDAPGDIDDYFDRLDKAFALLSDVSNVSEVPIPPPKPSTPWSRRPEPDPAAADTSAPKTEPKPSLLKTESELKAATVPKPEGESKSTNIHKIEESKASLPKSDPEVRAAIVFRPELDPKPANVFMPEPEPPASPKVPPPPEPVVPPPPEWTFVPARIVPPALSGTSLPSLADAFAALLAAEQSEGGRLGAAEWPASAAIAPALPPEELVEQVTRRVLERVSDRVVRETVDATVLATAERMIRDEIERIKAHIT
jgi:CheY-like chemotaxis protein